METTKEYNKRLIEKYPFLLPRDWKTDNPIENYDYSYTLLDDMPDGWRIAFSERMCEEIKEELVRINCLNEFRVLQIKEKFGSLRFYYDCFNNDKISEIVDKYETMSLRICINCGKPATKMSMGWISPYCDFCADRIGNKVRFKKITNTERISLQ